MKYKFCLSCDKPLTGKQRLYCSDACRKRYIRAIKSGHTLSAFVLKSTANVRLSTGNVRKYKNKRTFDVFLVVKFESGLPPGEWDRGLINDYLRRKIAQVVREVLIYEHPDWEIEVIVQSKYTGQS